MDPSAALSDIFDAIVEGDFDTLSDRVAGLQEWLRRDGFTPGDIRKESLRAFLNWTIAHDVTRLVKPDEPTAE